MIMELQKDWIGTGSFTSPEQIFTGAAVTMAAMFSLPPPKQRLTGAKARLGSHG